MAEAGFFSSYLSVPLLYVQHHKTLNKMFSISLNKTSPLLQLQNENILLLIIFC